MYQEKIAKSLNDFKQIVSQKYICFQGRSCQAEFWLYLLIYSLAGSILRIIPWIGCFLSGIWLLGLLLPTLGISARRLHDRGLSHWYLLLLLIPVIGSIVLLIMLIPRGIPEANAYGEPPAPMAPPMNDDKTVQIIMIIAFALAAIAAIRPYYPQHCRKTCQPPAPAEPVTAVEAPPAEPVKTPAPVKTAAKAPAPKKKASFNTLAIYRGLSRKAEDIVCYHRRGKFCSDPAFKNCLFQQDGVQVLQGGKIIYNLSSGQLYQGTSNDKNKCLLSIVELKTQKGEVKEANIYKGFIKARDIEEKRENGDITIVTKFNLTNDGIALVTPKPVYTVRNGRIYKGDSTSEKDCLFSYHSDLNGGRLLLTVAKFAE